MLGEENLSNLLVALTSIYEKKMVILNDGFGLYKNIFLYNIHDGKMLYILTQHSLYNRLHHPFLLCSCQRGDGVKNNSHVCKIIDHDKQLQYYNRSLHRWNRKKNKR